MKPRPGPKGERDSRLREDAEATLARAPEVDGPGRQAEELLHKLQVHQIELEMQNEELRRTQAALEESRDRYVDLYEFAPVGYLTLSRDGVIVEVNLACASLLGEERKKVAYRRFAGFIAAEDADRYHLAFMSLMKHDERQTMEVKLRHGDGSTFDARLDCLRVISGDGPPMLRIAITDVTERVRLQRQSQDQAEALADLHRRKDEFLATLSHELRSPLAPLANAVHLLRIHEGSENAMQHHARNIIERQVEQLRHLVDDLLEVSRITAGRMQLSLDRVVVNRIVERAVETLRPLIDQRKHVLSVTLSPQPIWLRADASRVEQVIVNLLTNAAKYTNEGGQIWLTVQQDHATCVLRVRDTGVGIAPELLPRIFDLFTQGERSLDRAQGGLGIGLSLVQRLVDLHGGTVEAHSALGHGSEFVVRLPVAATATPTPPPEDQEKSPASRGSLRSLVVDDNADTANSLAMLLEASGNHTRTCYDGPSALKAALDYRPHVVLLDIGLPGMNGFEVAKRLREQPDFQNVVLIALTGYGQHTDRALSREAGFDHHLVKPVYFQELLRILRTVARSEVYGEASNRVTEALRVADRAAERPRVSASSESS